MVIRNFWGRVIGIDLGTVNTVVSYNCQVVLEMPTVIAYDTVSNERFFGHEALDMADYEVEGLTVVWPIVDGKINEPEAVRDFLDHVIHKVCRHILAWDVQGNNLIVVAIACQLTSVFKRQVEGAMQQHANEIVLIEQPAAAALGEDIDLDKQRCVLVFDIGGGTTDAAAIARRGRIKDSSRSLPVAGNKLDDAIKVHVLKKFGVHITTKFAEQVKRTIGCAISTPENSGAFVEFSGFSDTGEVAVRITAEEMAEVILKERLDQIAAFGLEWFASLCNSNPETLVRMRAGVNLTGKQVLRQESMILLTGGGALLPGIDTLLSQKMHIDVKIAQDPLHAAAVGANKAGLNRKLLRRLAIEVDRFKGLTDATQTRPKKAGTKQEQAKAAIKEAKPAVSTT